MRALSLLLFVLCFSPTLPISAYANTSSCGQNCCDSMGGIQYCDSSAGRFVCQNGRYSSCYCTRRAIMDMQALEGCCMWKGGVYKVLATGVVVCNNGRVSEMCTLGNPIDEVVIGRKVFNQ